MLDSVVKTCLAKDPDDRFQSVHDFKLQLKWIAEGGSQFGTPAPVAARRQSRERSWIIATAVCALLAIAGLAARGFIPINCVVAPRGASTDWPSGSIRLRAVGLFNHNVVSPDGRMIAFIATGEGKQLLFVRRLNEAAAVPLAGTDGAYYPFWSPDSRFIGFFANGKLKKIEAGVELCRTSAMLRLDAAERGIATASSCLLQESTMWSIACPTVAANFSRDQD